MYKALLGLTGAVLLTGCATLVTDNAKPVNVVTSTGAKVDFTLDDQAYTAPTVVKFIKDGQNKVVSTNGENCAEKTIANKKIEPAFWGNILIGGLLGSTTDAAGNKMWTYDDTVTISCN